MYDRIRIDVNASIIRRPGRPSFYLEWCHAGVQHRQSLKTKVERIAIERAKAILKQAESSLWGTRPMGAMAIWDYAEKWLAELLLRGRTENTVKLNRTAVRYFVEWMRDELRFDHEPMLNEVTPDRLQTYFAWRAKQCTNVSTNRDRRVLKSMFSRAMKKGIVSTNPVSATDALPVVRRVKPVPSEEEILRFLEEAKKPIPLLGPGGKGNGKTRRKNPLVHDVALLIVNTGLRLNEALTLRWDEINTTGGHYSDGTIYVRSKPENRIKDREERVLPLTDAVRLMLLTRRQLTGEKEWVFSTSGGLPCEGATFRHLFKRVAIKAGLGWINAQSLRRAFATLCASSGMPAFVLKGLMGHSSIATTEQHYIAPIVAKDWMPRSIRGLDV